MRRLAFVLALAALGAASSHAADTLRVGKASPTAFAMLPLAVGDEEGFYRKHGVEVEIIDFGGGAEDAPGDGGRQHRCRHRLGRRARDGRQGIARTRHLQCRRAAALHRHRRSL